MSRKFFSWGRYPNIKQSKMIVSDRFAELPLNAETELPYGVLPYGNGRSYGDSCLNEGGVIVGTEHLNRFISFDAASGILRCEGGVLLSEILDLVVPQGWFIAVTPGTKFVSVGGAIANDVHGKNHHRAGTFGCHVRCFELLRSTGERLICSPEQNTEYFRTTISGLGLTGLITWAEIQLRRVSNSAISLENIKYKNIDEFFQLSAESEADYEYTVAWVDCLATGNSLGRGHFTRGNHAPSQAGSPRHSSHKLNMFLDSPISLINKTSLRAFNTVYYHKQLQHSKHSISHYDPFFYPLDSIHNWNRIYGPKGFLQYQCVVPMDESRDAVAEMLKRIALSGAGSFLMVLKVFGDVESPGYTSFPRPGTTLALDFPYLGPSTLELFNELDQIVDLANGAIYPAKDAHMSAAGFKKYYPNWRKLAELKDPNISSSFWRRVSEQ